MRSARSQTTREQKLSSKRLKTKPLIILLSVLLFGNLLWFTLWVKAAKSSKEEVAAVDGATITREAWMVAMEEKIGRETLRELVNEKVMEAAAKEYGISVSKKELETELALIHSRDEDAYTGLDLKKEKEAIKSALILEKVLTKDIVIDDQEIKKNYEENLDVYHVETAARTSIIIVDTKEEAEQAIKEVKDGSNFAALAREKSVDLASASLGGDIGYINESSTIVDDAIIQAATDLKKGKLSEPIALEDGRFAVAYVSDIMKGKKFKLKEVKEHIQRQLALEQLPETITPDAFWKDFNVTWFYE